MNTLLKALQKVLIYKTLHYKKGANQTLVVFDVRYIESENIVEIKSQSGSWYNLDNWALCGEDAYIIKDYSVKDKNSYWTGSGWTLDSKEAAYFKESNVDKAAESLRKYYFDQKIYSHNPVAIISDYSIHKD
jgi:hypothetical protein